MTPVLLTDDAARDLDEIFARGQWSTSGGGDVLTTLEAGMNDLATNPGDGEIPLELLELGIRDYQQRIAGRHRIIYRVTSDGVLVLLIDDRRRSLQMLLQRRLLES